MTISLKKIITILFIYGLTNLVYAVQNISVYGGTRNKIRVSLYGLHDQSAMQEVMFDLNVSGELLVNNLDGKNITTTNSSYDGYSYNLKASIAEQNDQQTLEYELKDSLGRQLLLQQKISFNADSKRRVIHMMDNAVYQIITHSPATFLSKIATIIKNNNQYQLIISDYDGYNPVSILKTKTPISSLAWSPDNSELAYVFYANKPLVYTQSLATGKRTMVAAFEGSNSSPVFINDHKLIVTLSKDEGSHLYIIDNTAYINNKAAFPLMRFGGIDTEADVSADGKVIFTSDYDVSPQIFLSDLAGRTPVKISNLIGHHLTTARFSRDGSKIVLVNKENGFRTFYYDLRSQTISCISDSNADLAPSFSPNNQLVLYSSNQTIYISSIIHNKISPISLQDSPYDEIIDQRWSN